MAISFCIIPGAIWPSIPKDCVRSVLRMLICMREPPENEPEQTHRRHTARKSRELVSFLTPPSYIESRQKACRSPELHPEWGGRIDASCWSERSKERG